MAGMSISVEPKSEEPAFSAVGRAARMGPFGLDVKVDDHLSLEANRLDDC